MKRTLFLYPPPVTDPLVGQVLSERYRVLERLGEGGIGRVYLAEHLETGREVALKILLPEYANNDALVATFLEEARTVSRLGHENVIDIYYGGRTSTGVVFLAMERLQGCDLADLLKLGPLSWERGRKLFLQVAQALAAVHAHGLVHGDIKPGNIFVVNGGLRHDFVKVLDFGIAKAVRQGAERSNDDRFAILGTPQYMAPEQTIGGDVDGRADIYSLGCVMYRALTGEVPFAGDTAIELMAKHSYERPVPPRERRPDLDIPPAVESIVLRAMAKAPKDRFASMQEMVDAIMRARLTSTSLPAASPSAQFRMDDQQVVRRAQRRRRAMVGGLALALLFAAGSAYRVIAGLRPGQVQVTTTPADVDVRVDGVLVAARTPASFVAARGRREMTVSRAGYVPRSLALEIEPGSTLNVTVPPLEPSERTGLEITSDPPGAQIWIDGVQLLGPGGAPAVTGQVITRVRPGRRAIELRSPLGTWRKEVEVQPDRIVPVHGTLPAPKPQRQAKTKRKTLA